MKRLFKSRLEAWLILTLALAGFSLFSGSSSFAQSGKPSPDTLQTSHFQELWEEIFEISEEASELGRKDDARSQTLLETLTAREPEYVRLLHDAQDALAGSEAQEQFEEIESLREDIRDLQEESDELRIARTTAPDSSWNPLSMTKEKIAERLREIPGEIAENERAIEVLKREIIVRLARTGMKITPQELDYFLVSAEGNDLLRLMAIAGNIKKIQLAIEKELIANQDNITLAKAYTGMYFVVVDAYAEAHNVAFSRIADYRERVEEISDEAESNLKEALKLRKAADKADKAIYDTNIRINEKVIQVAQIYDSLLVRRVQNLENSKAVVDRKVVLARNTYNTIVNGSSLISLVNTGLNELSAVLDFEMPELKVIYDVSMFNTFKDLSEKIREAD